MKHARESGSRYFPSIAFKISESENSEGLILHSVLSGGGGMCLCENTKYCIEKEPTKFYFGKKKEEFFATKKYKLLSKNLRFFFPARETGTNGVSKMNQWKNGRK